MKGRPPILGIDSIIREIGKLPQDFHKAGTVSQNVLQTIVELCGTSINYSMETGSGKTTLLFSHISQDHRVFAVDEGTHSISAVCESPLFNSRSVKYIEGPTQRTLPLYDFGRKIEVAYLDGPHAYPFPDLEYYYVYPNLEVMGFLILDDIHIPTINNLFNFLAEDDMFELLRVVETTAFFRRTNAPPFYPYGDGWEKQKYNRRRFPICGPYCPNDQLQRYPGTQPATITFDRGFYHWEGDFRWVSAEGSFTIPAPMLVEPSTISFELTCGFARHYSQFPFGVKLFLNGEVRGTLVFSADLHKELVKIQVSKADGDTHIRIVSDQSFIPSKASGSEDHRQLSLMFSNLRILSISSRAG